MLKMLGGEFDMLRLSRIRVQINMHFPTFC